MQQLVAGGSGVQAELSATNLWWLLIVYAVISLAVALLAILSVWWAIVRYLDARRAEMKESAPSGDSPT